MDKLRFYIYDLIKLCLQIGFESPDVFNYVQVPAVEIPQGTNVGVNGRWMFPITNSHGRTFIFHILILPSASSEL